MNNIIVGFSASDSFIARQIRKISKSETSHSYVKFYDCCLGIDVIMESSWAGYRIIPYEKFLNRTKIIKEFQSKRDLSDGIKWASSFLNNPYDWFSAFILGIKRWFGREIKTPSLNPRKWHCTESVIRILNCCGIAKELNPESLLPDDLLNYCKSNNNFVEIK